jgi:hypothetical protein
MPREQRFRITDVWTHQPYVIDLDFDARDMPGWQPKVIGWSVGSLASGAAIELDEPLDGIEIGIFPASNHVLLWGKADPAIPDVFLLRGGGVRGNVEFLLHSLKVLSLSRRRWAKLSSEQLRSQARPGHIRWRFDRRPIRIGHHIIEMLG